MANTQTPAFLNLLQQRNSSPKLTGPAPSESELEEMLRCALRSPDHAWLRPWRFVSIRGERREDFGELMLHSLLRRDPDADEAARDKARKAPLRAPLLVAVLVSLGEHPKVPHWEQRVSAGCAAFSMLLAAEAMGYAGIWRTGAAAEDKQLARDLGATEAEEIVAFLYLGSRDGEGKALPELATADFHRRW